MMWMNGMTRWTWLLMIAGTLGIWVMGAMAIQAVIDPRPPKTPAAPDPTRVLNERLARSEIDTDEYLQKRRLITSSH